MWVKGNLHTHTNFSDGDSEPSAVCRFYADNGYSFLSITDHNRFTDPSTIDSAGLLLIPGIELSLMTDDEQPVPIHVNGFGMRHFAVPSIRASRAQTLQVCVDAVRAAGGVAQINHPNFRFAFDDTDMAQVEGAQLLEIYNGHPSVYNDGDDVHLPVEDMWDVLLTADKRIYVSGVDDAHHFTQDFEPRRANPKRGWIWARVEELTVPQVLSALERGDFYASSGVELAELEFTADELRLAIAAQPGVDYTIDFIGDGGHTLASTSGTGASFSVAGRDIIYLRARVTASGGGRAWTQPLWPAS